MGETAVLLAGLLPDMTAFVELPTKVNPPLAARCVAESGGVRPAPATVYKVQAALVEITSSLTAPVKKRIAAGNALNYLGDPRDGVGVKDNLPDIVWCKVPAGEFLMGYTKQIDRMTHGWEMPQHAVHLAAFAFSQYLITNGHGPCKPIFTFHCQPAVVQQVLHFSV